jgi:hypothetical protein
MVVLWPTKKLARALVALGDLRQSDTWLGDWYVNQVVVDRRPLLLLVCSASLLAIVEPARDVRHCLGVSQRSTGGSRLLH